MTLNVLKLVAIIFLSLLSGCSNNIGNNVKSKKYHLGVNLEEVDCGAIYLANCSFEGVANKKNIFVRYPSGLKPQATQISNLVANSFEYIYKMTGVSAYFSDTTFYLIYAEGIVLLPMTYLYFDGGHITDILVYNHRNASVESIIAQSSSLPFTFYHEIFEISIGADRPDSMRIMYDPMLLDNRTDKSEINTTRWFREGFSSYCGWLAFESMLKDENFEQKAVPRLKLVRGIAVHPFSSLAKIEKDLFIWNQESQFSFGSHPNMPCDYQTEKDYYDASFGLFLIIRDKFGDNAIRGIVNEIKTLEVADGPGLIRAFNSVLKTDIGKFVEDFSYPDTGLYVDYIWPKNSDTQLGMKVLFIEQNSVAQKAGIKKDDVIYKLNDIKVESNLDFEMAIYKLMDQESITVHLRREGIGEMTLKLQLHD